MKFLFLYLVAVFLICMAVYVGTAIRIIWRNTKRERVLRLYRQAELIARRRLENE